MAETFNLHDDEIYFCTVCFKNHGMNMQMTDLVKKCDVPKHIVCVCVFWDSGESSSVIYRVKIGK